MSRLELFMLHLSGKIISLLGAVGLSITVLFDKIRCGWTFPTHFGWFQLCGMLSFITITIFGIAVDVFLKDVKDMLDNYLRK